MTTRTISARHNELMHRNVTVQRLGRTVAGFICDTVDSRMDDETVNTYVSISPRAAQDCNIDGEWINLNEVTFTDMAPSAPTLPEGLRIARDDEAGWTYRMSEGHTLWVTDAPAKEEVAPVAPTVTKRIGEYDKLTKDYPAYVSIDGGPEEYIGSRPTTHDASLLASDYIIQFYNDNYTPEKAAELIMEEVITEGRHEQLAKDMGGAWVTGERWEEAGAPDQEELREWAIADKAPDGCTACGDEGCPYCDPELASEADAPEAVDEYRAFAAADDAWQAELERIYGGRAGDVRYTKESGIGPTLAPLYAEFCRARDAWWAKRDASTPEMHCPDCGDALYLPNGADRCSCGTSAMWPASCFDRPPCSDAPPPALSATEFLAGYEPATVEEAVRLAYAMRHVPLPDQERYAHRVGTNDTPTPLDLINAGICPACGGAHHPQRCPEIGALLFMEPPTCPDCGDPVQTVGRCKACTEVEGWEIEAEQSEQADERAQQEALQQVELERRFEFSALPCEWSF
jgi:hypothetical protein